MQIFVTLQNGQRIILKVDGNDSIGNIKNKIQSKEGISRSQQRIYFRGTELKDNKCLSDYNITKNSELNLDLGDLGSAGPIRVCCVL